MENLEKYLKYYFLENYLFNDVHKNFQKREHLTPEEFFAIVTVCYPNDFTVADYRACASLKDFGEEVSGNPTVSTSAYFEYLAKCKKLAHRFNLSLRDFDRILWAKDFYEGKNGLRHLVDGL